jgi:predicted transcriptional regulator
MQVVYFIQGTRGGPIKIGTSSQVGARLYALSVSQKKKLRVLRTIPGSYPAERALHEKFAHAHTGKGREWFKPVPELLEFIANPTSEIRSDNPLHDWLNRSDLTADAFARLANIDAGEVCRILKGRRLPSSAGARRIELATGGAVAASSWDVFRPGGVRKPIIYLGMTVPEFMRLVRVPPPVAYKWAARGAAPNLESVRRIVDRCGGRVTAQMILDYHFPPPAEVGTAAPASSPADGEAA